MMKLGERQPRLVATFSHVWENMSSASTSVASSRHMEQPASVYLLLDSCKEGGVVSTNFGAEMAQFISEENADKPLVYFITDRPALSNVHTCRPDRGARSR